MAIKLSWDLFIIVFFTVIIAYSFIIGKNQTMKVIIGTYIAVLTADGLGNLVEQYVLGTKGAAPNILPVGLQDSALIILKIVVFILGIVLIAVRGGFDVQLPYETTTIGKLITTFCFGFLNAGLIVSTILVYISGFSFVEASAELASNPIFDLYKQSPLVAVIINNYNFWFSLPAIAFVFSSFIGERAK